ncbi:MAG TPA: NAD-binding protein [Nitrososphaerales archaeon]|nr:NAD-binding protein [Nitrososphaerales archaeon]HUK75215.1 NAD-binding protein [Nitrososphaerales archaeon]
MTATPVFGQARKRRAGKRQSRTFGFLLYQALYSPVIFFRTVHKQIVLLGVMFAWGAVVFSYYEHLPLLASFLASVSTITTIGLYVPHGGNFLTMPSTEAGLLIVMIIVSVGSAASILQQTVNTVVNGDLARGEAEKRLIARLKDHAIVIGYTHLGRYVADKLDELGLDYVVVTHNPATYEALTKKKALAVLEQENRPIIALKEAGIETAATLIAAHEKDSDNMVVILSARRLRPTIRIIAVVHDDELMDTAKNAGADVVVPSSITVGHLLALSATTRDLVGLVFSERVGTKEIAQFAVFKSSQLIGKKLEEISLLAHVVGMVRNGELVKNLFDPALRVQEDDTLLVFGDPQGLHQLEEEAKAS